MALANSIGVTPLAALTSSASAANIAVAAQEAFPDIVTTGVGDAAPIVEANGGKAVCLTVRDRHALLE